MKRDRIDYEKLTEPKDLTHVKTSIHSVIGTGDLPDSVKRLICPEKAERESMNDITTIKIRNRYR